MLVASRWRAVRPAPENEFTTLLGDFLDAIFGRQLTRGISSSHQHETLAYCLLRLLDADKRRCLWQEAYRRRDGLLGAANWAASRQGHLFFCPNGFAHNGRRGGHPLLQGRYRDPGAFSESNLQTLNVVTIDMDHELVAPDILTLHNASQAAFLAELHRTLASLGADAYLVVQTRPGYGYQVHLLLDPCPAQDNLPLWKRVSRGLQALFAAWGADPVAAGRAVQVYRLPGCPRPDFPGYYTQLLVYRQGRRLTLAELADRLHHLGFLPPESASPSPDNHAVRLVRLSPDMLEGETLMGLIEAGLVRGFPEGSRNWGLFCLARALATEGWAPDRIEAAVTRVNRLCRPGPLPAAELHKLLRSARRYTWPVSPSIWNWVCRSLGVELTHPGARARGTASRLRRTPDYYAEQIRQIGEHLDAYLEQHGSWKGPFSALVEALGLPPSAGRALRAAIAQRVAAGRLLRRSRPGRGGYVALEIINQKSCIVNTGGDGWESAFSGLSSQYCENVSAATEGKEAGLGSANVQEGQSAALPYAAVAEQVLRVGVREAGRVQRLGRWVAALSPLQSAAGTTVRVLVGMAGSSQGRVVIRVRLPATQEEVRRAVDRVLPKVPARWQLWWRQDRDVLVWLVRWLVRSVLAFRPPDAPEGAGRGGPAP